MLIAATALAMPAASQALTLPPDAPPELAALDVTDVTVVKNRGGDVVAGWRLNGVMQAARRRSGGDWEPLPTPVMPTPWGLFGGIALSDQGEVLAWRTTRTPNTNRGFSVVTVSLTPGASAWSPAVVVPGSYYKATAHFAPNGDAYVIADAAGTNAKYNTVFRRPVGEAGWAVFPVPFGGVGDWSYHRIATNGDSDVFVVRVDVDRFDDNSGPAAVVRAGVWSVAAGEWGPAQVGAQGPGPSGPWPVRAGLGDDGLASVVLGGEGYSRFLTLRQPGSAEWAVPRPLPPEPPDVEPPRLPGFPDDHVPPPGDRVAPPAPPAEVIYLPWPLVDARATDAECATWATRAAAQHRRALFAYGVARTTRSAATRRAAYAIVRARLRSRDGFLALRSPSCG